MHFLCIKFFNTNVITFKTSTIQHFTNMEYSERYQYLSSIFSMGIDKNIDDSKVGIRFFDFDSRTELNNIPFVAMADGNIQENFRFQCPVFVPLNGEKSFSNAILLLHGLNERSWNKYLVWAEKMCINLQRPVILFPIAYHINRSPAEWVNPRAVRNIIDERKTSFGNDRALSFANVSLSKRLTELPIRFFNSGYQSLRELEILAHNIKMGKIPLFNESCHIDVFAYSIGAFLAQITFMVNRNNIFGSSKLYLFCGGSIFSAMQGRSRSIMDGAAFERLLDFYTHRFRIADFEHMMDAKVLQMFYAMIAPDRLPNLREQFYGEMSTRLSGISLTNDKVIPYSGVVQAMGEKRAQQTIQLHNFDYDYSHENPFPVGASYEATLVNQSFEATMANAINFLSAS